MIRSLKWRSCYVLFTQNCGTPKNCKTPPQLNGHPPSAQLSQIRANHLKDSHGIDINKRYKVLYVAPLISVGNGLSYTMSNCMRHERAKRSETIPRPPTGFFKSIFIKKKFISQTQKTRVQIPADAQDFSTSSKIASFPNLCIKVSVA